MNAREAIKISIDMGNLITMSYLEDLTDEELMKRPCSGCNHLNWQIGHLIVSEHGMLSQVMPGAMPELPPGFAGRYTKETAGSDDPQAFAAKADLLTIQKQQRAATLAALEKQTDEDLSKPSGIEYAPTVGEVFSMQGSHWLMHVGQWAVVRRQLGRKPLF